MTEWPNAYGSPSFDDLDESWHRYLAADKVERKKMHEDAVTHEAMGCGCLLFIALVVFVIGGFLCLFG